MKALVRWLGDWAIGAGESTMAGVSRRRFLRGSVLGAAALATGGASAVGRAQGLAETKDEEELLCTGIIEPECLDCRGGLIWKCYECVRNVYGDVCSTRGCEQWCEWGGGGECECSW